MATAPADRASLFSSLEDPFGLPAGLLESVMQAESGGRLDAVSSAGAQGPFQLMPGTARELGVEDPTDLAQAATGAAQYLQSNLNRFGSIESALAAYNWGPGNLSRKGYDARPAETKAYVDKVMNGITPGSVTTGGENSLNELLGAMSAGQAAAQSTTNQIIQAYGMAGASAEEAAKAEEALGAATRSAALTRLEGELATQQARVTAANAFGTNVQDQSEVVTGLASTLRPQAQALLEQQQRVAQMEGNATLANPLGLIFDLLYGDGERSKLEALQNQFSTTSTVLQNLNAATQQTAQTQNAISQTLTETSIQKVAEAQALEAQSKVAQMRAANSRYKLGELDAILQMNSSQVDTVYKAFQLQEAEEQRLFNREQREAASADRALRLQTYLDNVASRKQSQDDETQMVSWVNAGRAALGQTPLEGSRVLSIFRAGGPVKETLQQTMLIGMTADETGAVRLGTGPAQSVVTLRQANAKVAPIQEPVVRMIESQVAQAQSTALDKKDTSTIFSNANRLVEEEARRQAGNVRSGGADNIYAAPPLDALKDLPAIKELPFIQSLLAKGTDITNPDRVLADAATVIKEGGAPFSDVVSQVATLYETVVLTNNASKTYERYGVPNQSGYQVTVNLGTALGDSLPLNILSGGPLGSVFSSNSVKVDMADATAVGRVLTTYMTRQRFGSASRILEPLIRGNSNGN